MNGTDNLFELTDQAILDETDALRLARLTTLGLKRVAETTVLKLRLHIGGLWAVIGIIIGVLIKLGYK